MDLEEHYDKEWEKVKNEYPPDPAMEEIYKTPPTLLELIAELEKITKRN